MAPKGFPVSALWGIPGAQAIVARTPPDNKARPIQFFITASLEHRLSGGLIADGELLEIKLHPNLRLAFGIHYRPNNADCRRADRRRRQPEVGVVEQIERLPSHLQTESLVKNKIASDAEIEVPETRRTQDLPARVPKTDAGYRRECGLSKPV